METGIGAIVLIIAIIFLTVAYRATDYRTTTGYRLFAEFNKLGTIKTGSDVRVSGVPIGKVSDLALDPETFKARITLDIDNSFIFPEDTIAIIRSEGLLGGHFVELLPGGSPDNLTPDDVIEFTQDSVDLLQIFGKFMFSAGEANLENGKN
tara:strand:+ start:332 stop:784 length:453 start_codon:yes stop_codon:yes gene_type:complete